MADDFPIRGAAEDFGGVLQFALRQATYRGDLKQLLWLLDDANSIGSIGGDPGWSIDRRKASVPESEFAEWPASAEFCVQQGDPHSMFEIPLEYLTWERFENCLRAVLHAQGISIAPIEEIWRRNVALAANAVAMPGNYDHQFIRQLLLQEPFRPFRLIMSAGDIYEIRDPQQALLSRTEILLSTGPAIGNINTGLVPCPLLNIAEVELLSADQETT